jgi:hypothetical protein
MARNVTAQEVIDTVQIMVEDPLHALASEAEYLKQVNRAHARLYSYYVAAEPDRFRTEETITAAAPPNSATSSLPATWLATIAVDYASGSERRPLKRLQEHERNDYIGQTGTAEAFRALGANMVLYPTPTQGQTYIHVYLPTAPVLVVGTSIDCRIGHEVYLEQWTARALLKMKQEYDGRWDDELAKLETELKLEANLRYFSDVALMTADDRTSRYPWRQRWGTVP